MVCVAARPCGLRGSCGSYARRAPALAAPRGSILSGSDMAHSLCGAGLRGSTQVQEEAGGSILQSLVLLRPVRNWLKLNKKRRCGFVPGGLPKLGHRPKTTTAATSKYGWNLFFHFLSVSSLCFSSLFPLGGCLTRQLSFSAKCEDTPRQCLPMRKRVRMPHARGEMPS